MRPAKVDGRVRRRIEELFDAGGSVRTITKALAVEMLDPPARSTIGDVLKGRQRPEGAPSAPVASPRASGAAPKRVIEVPEAPEVAPASDSGDQGGPTPGPFESLADAEALLAPPADSPPYVVMAWILVREARADLAAARAARMTGDATASNIATLSANVTRLLKFYQEVAPPPPPDPAKDPTNIAARAMVLQTVVRSIEAAGARVGRICLRCRQDIES